MDLSEHCSNVQGFFFNIDLEHCESELLKIERLNMNNKLVSNGIVFVPVVKKHIADLIRIMEMKKVFVFLIPLIFSLIILRIL
jgi:hypothetical protein